jgi:hypothetical protein
MADHNIEGHFRALVLILEQEPWKGIWEELDVAVRSFESLGISPDIGDAELWQLCQANDIVLITANRNNGAPESLEEVIRRHNTPTSLPVLTLANPLRFAQERAYAEEVAEQVLTYLVDLDNYRGAGRIFV